MNEDITEIIENIAYGDGPKHVIEQQWLDPSQLEGDLQAAAERACAAYSEWLKTAETLQKEAETLIAIPMPHN